MPDQEVANALRILSRHGISPYEHKALIRKLISDYMSEASIFFVSGFTNKEGWGRFHLSCRLCGNARSALPEDKIDRGGYFNGHLKVNFSHNESCVLPKYKDLLRILNVEEN